MKNVLKLLKDKDFDPIDKMRMLAIGDAVGLELMSQKEYDQEEELDQDGLVETESGRSVALELIPVRLRAEMTKELAKYIHSQKKPEEGGDEGDEKEAKVVVYVPANNRDVPIPVFEKKTTKKTKKKIIRKKVKK